MKTNRRSVLFGAPALLFGLSECEDLAFAQTTSGGGSRIAPGVADFWATRMGVPAKLLLKNPTPTTKSPGPGRGIEPLSNRNGLGQSNGGVVRTPHFQTLSIQSITRTKRRYKNQRANF